ncbi:MAG TPA: cytochrome c [Stellaceae bacterium]|nr:cytochrome c [Stellaceae bacterium]
MKLKITGCVALIGLALSSAAAFAQDKAALVKERQDFMERQQHDFDAIAAYAKGKGDQGSAIDKVNDLLALAPKIVDQFQPGTSSVDFPGKSRAKPEIWQNWDKFKATPVTLQAEEQKLLAAVRVGDRQRVQDQLVATFRDGCGSCHTDYRAPRS